MLEEEVFGRVGGVYFRNGRRNVSRSCAVEQGELETNQPSPDSRRIVGYIYIYTYILVGVVTKRDLL